MIDTIWYQNVFNREGYEIDPKLGTKAHTIAGWLNLLSQSHTILEVQMTTGTYTIVIVNCVPHEDSGLILSDTVTWKTEEKVEVVHPDWKVGMAVSPPLFSQNWNRIPGE